MSRRSSSSEGPRSLTKRDASRRKGYDASSRGFTGANRPASNKSFLQVGPYPPRMITLIGVGHVFDIGARLKAAIAARSPELVCLELDRARFQSLLERPKKGPDGAPMMYQM